MPFKRHNPGCPCCDEISSSSSSSSSSSLPSSSSISDIPVCECDGNPGFFSRGFAGTPAIKIVISGLPSSYQWSDFFTADGFQWQKNDWTLSGLDSINGTYFLELDKKDSFCIFESSSIGGLVPSNYTESFERSIRNSGSICVEVSTLSGSVSQYAGPAVVYLNTQYTIKLNQGADIYYEILGEVRISCPSYDYTTTSGDNSMDGGFAAPRTWPKSSGEIKILRRAIAFDDCGFTVEDSSGQVFETIGTLTAEMVDL